MNRAGAQGRILQPAPRVYRASKPGAARNRCRAGHRTASQRLFWRETAGYKILSLARTASFLLRVATVGIAAALLLVWLRPDLVRTPRPVVEVRQAAEAPAPPPADSVLSFAEAVNRASPAVVNIYSARLLDRPGQIAPPSLERFLDREVVPESRQIQTGLGSGVIFSDAGYVLTNYHVIAGANEVHVMLSDGRNSNAALVGSDPETDLAVLKIQLEALPTIVLGDSESLRVGDVVLAIGNPYGVGQTVTQGIVSATGRKRLGINTYENFIQTDAAINPGNSGGALVNSRGELVGINTAIFSRTGGSQGIGFAIPATLARKVLTEVIETGHVVRGWLGISMNDLTLEQAAEAGLEDPYGVVVAALFENSPAHRAGLQPGDILLRINRERVHDARQMLDLIARVKPGDQVTIDGIRRGKAFQTQTEVIQRPAIASPLR